MSELACEVKMYKLKPYRDSKAKTRGRGLGCRACHRADPSNSVKPKGITYGSEVYGWDRSKSC